MSCGLGVCFSCGSGFDVFSGLMSVGELSRIASVGIGVSNSVVSAWYLETGCGELLRCLYQLECRMVESAELWMSALRASTLPRSTSTPNPATQHPLSQTHN